MALPLEVDGETLGHVIALRASFAFDAGELDLLGTVAAQTAVGSKDRADRRPHRAQPDEGLLRRPGGRPAGRRRGPRPAARLRPLLTAARVVVLPHDAASRADADRARRSSASRPRWRASWPAPSSTAATTAAAGSSPCSAPTARPGRAPARRARRLPLVVGVSNPATGAEGVRPRFEARQAARAAPVVTERAGRRHVRRSRALQVPAARQPGGASATATAMRCAA